MPQTSDPLEAMRAEELALLRLMRHDAERLYGVLDQRTMALRAGITALEQRGDVARKLMDLDRRCLAVVTAIQDTRGAGPEVRLRVAMRRAFEVQGLGAQLGLLLAGEEGVSDD